MKNQIIESLKGLGLYLFYTALMVIDVIILPLLILWNAILILICWIITKDLKMSIEGVCAVSRFKTKNNMEIIGETFLDISERFES